MAYSRTIYVNDSTPPISAENLNNAEQGIFDASQKAFVVSNALEGKVDKEKTYATIAGANYTQKLWNVTQKRADTFSSYSYSIFTSGFDSGFILVTGFQPTTLADYPVVAFYDSSMNLISSVNGTAGSGFAETEISVPDGTYYIYINGAKTGDYMPKLRSVTFLTETISSDVSQLKMQENYLNDSKQEREKSYTPIAGGTTNTGLWSTSEDKSYSEFTSYQYKVYSSGFTAGGYIAIDGYQPTYYNQFHLCAFYDSNMNRLAVVGENSSGDSLKFFAFVPYNTAYIYVNGRPSSTYPNIYDITYQDYDFSGLAMLNFEMQNWMERRYRDGEYVNYTRKTPDHAVIAFCLDDSRSDVSDASDLFITKEVPLCLATVPSRLSDVCDNGDTVLETCQKTVENGGEILCHSMSVIDANTTPAEYFTYFVENKKTLEDAGLKVDGIVKAGGGSDDPDIKVVKTYLRSFYDYGTGFQYINDNRYNINRLSMEYSLDTLKSRVDGIANGGMLFFYGHGANDLGEEWIDKISDLIDYIGTVENAEIVTIGEALTEYLVAAFKQ